MTTNTLTAPTASRTTRPNASVLALLGSMSSDLGNQNATPIATPSMTGGIETGVKSPSFIAFKRSASVVKKGLAGEKTISVAEIIALLGFGLTSVVNPITFVMAFVSYYLGFSGGKNRRNSHGDNRGDNRGKTHGKHGQAKGKQDKATKRTDMVRAMLSMTPLKTALDVGMPVNQILASLGINVDTPYTIASLHAALWQAIGMNNKMKPFGYDRIARSVANYRGEQGFPADSFILGTVTGYANGKITGVQAALYVRKGDELVFVRAIDSLPADALNNWVIVQVDGNTPSAQAVNNAVMTKGTLGFNQIGIPTWNDVSSLESRYADMGAALAFATYIVAQNGNLPSDVAKLEAIETTFRQGAVQLHDLINEVRQPRAIVAPTPVGATNGRVTPGFSI